MYKHVDFHSNPYHQMKSSDTCSIFRLAIMIILGIKSAMAAYPQCSSRIPCHGGETCVLQGQPGANQGIGKCMKTIVAPGGYCGGNIAQSIGFKNFPLVCTAGYTCGNNYCIRYPQCTSHVTCRGGDTCVLQGQPRANMGIGLCRPTVVAPGGYCGPNIAASTPRVRNFPLKCGAGSSCINNVCSKLVSSKLNSSQLFVRACKQ